MKSAECVVCIKTDPGKALSWPEPSTITWSIDSAGDPEIPEPEPAKNTSVPTPERPEPSPTNISAVIVVAVTPLLNWAMLPDCTQLLLVNWCFPAITIHPD